MTAALEAIGLQKRFGGLVATNNVTLALEKGARHALIGPNGAGKTTFVNLLTGTIEPTGGRILLEGREIGSLKQYQRTRLGLARTFQINQLFPELTPRQTVSLAIAERRRMGKIWWRAILRDVSVQEEAIEVLGRFSLAEFADTQTKVLPYGKQRALEIATAIASKPSVLLLDEPAAGVPEGERHEILAAVAALPADVTVLLIEHDMDLVFAFAKRITVLVGGAVLVEGTPDEIAANPLVRAAYLGEGGH